MQTLGRLAFIGGGNMAEALLGGLRRGATPLADITVAEPREERRRFLETMYAVRTSATNASAVEQADIVLLSVKPQQMRAAALEIAASIGEGTLVISIAAGIPVGAVEGWLGADKSVVRAMPNRPALDGVGATALFGRASLHVKHRNAAQAVMSAVGTTVWVEREADMDVVTALSGSGPAYFFLLMEALETAACELGLAPDIARSLTLQTAAGAAHMAKHSTDAPSVLRAQVTSQGGTTEAALAVMEAANLRVIVARAVEAAAKRSAELATEFAKG